MNRDDPHTDNAMRQALRDSLRQAPAAGNEALQARVLTQWRQRHAHLQDQAQMVPAGGAGSWRPPQRAWAWGGLGMALIVLALAYAWTQRPDPALEDLMHPDVLSQIGLGEL